MKPRCSDSIKPKTAAQIALSSRLFSVFASLHSGKTQRKNINDVYSKAIENQLTYNDVIVSMKQSIPSQIVFVAHYH
jgi:hypothetical protein